MSLCEKVYLHEESTYYSYAGKGLWSVLDKIVILAFDKASWTLT